MPVQTRLRACWLCRAKSVPPVERSPGNECEGTSSRSSIRGNPGTGLRLLAGRSAYPARRARSTLSRGSTCPRQRPADRWRCCVGRSRNRRTLMGVPYSCAFRRLVHLRLKAGRGRWKPAPPGASSSAVFTAQKSAARSAPVGNKRPRTNTTFLNMRPS